MKTQVDATIEAICKWLQKRTNKEISEPTKALAELISARAALEVN